MSLPEVVHGCEATDLSPRRKARDRPDYDDAATFLSRMGLLASYWLAYTTCLWAQLVAVPNRHGGPPSGSVDPVVHGSMILFALSGFMYQFSLSTTTSANHPSCYDGISPSSTVAVLFYHIPDFMVVTMLALLAWKLVGMAHCLMVGCTLVNSLAVMLSSLLLPPSSRRKMVVVEESAPDSNKAPGQTPTVPNSERIMVV